MESNIQIVAKTNGKETVWGFCKSLTGQLDYCGKIEPSHAGWQELDSSTYFTPAWYLWLPENLRAEINVYVSDDAKLTDAGTFAFLTHIGALLLAVEENDSLLVAELICRRTSVFVEFFQLVLYIIKPVAPQALFALLYGRFSDTIEFAKIYKAAALFNPQNAGAAELLFEAAKEDLNPHPEKESAEEMFIRYFKNLSEQKRTLKMTIGIVGAQYRNWACNAESVIDDMLDEQTARDFVEGTSRVREAKDRLLASIKVSVQAEPHNPADANAIAVSLEDVPAKISGNGGLAKAGYIRATGAAILRRAMPHKFAYKAKLARLGNMQDGCNGVTIMLEV